MQKVKLPHQLDPYKSALKRSDYVGVMASKDMQRLTDAIVSSDDWVEAELQFAKDEQGLTVLRGYLKTTVSLICQRSNEVYDQPLYVEFIFSPVQGQEDEESLPDAYDPVEVDEYGMIDLLQLFEDELLLALPLVPRRAEVDGALDDSNMQFGELKPEEERPNPFAVLKELKRDQE